MRREIRAESSGRVRRVLQAGGKSSAQMTAAMAGRDEDCQVDASQSPGRSEGWEASLQAGEDRNHHAIDVGDPLHRGRQELVGARGKGWRTVSERRRGRGGTGLWLYGLVVVSPSPRIRREDRVREHEAPSCSGL